MNPPVYRAVGQTEGLISLIITVMLYVVGNSVNMDNIIIIHVHIYCEIIIKLGEIALSISFSETEVRNLNFIHK